MSRVSTSEHPLAVYRRSIGATQPAMAKLLGISKSSIQAIELGNLKMSERLSLKLFALRGTNQTDIKEYAELKVAEYKRRLFRELKIK